MQIPLLLAAFALEIWRRAPNADLIHAQWTLTALLALPARWRFGTRLAVTARGSDLRLLPAWLNRWLHRQVDAAIDCFGPQPWNVSYKAACAARWSTLPLLVVTGDPAARCASDTRPTNQERARLYRSRRPSAPPLRLDGASHTH